MHTADEGRPTLRAAAATLTTSLAHAPARAIAIGAVALTVLSVALFGVLAVQQRREALGNAAQRTQVLAAQLAEHAGRVLDAANLMLDQATVLVEGRSWAAVEADAGIHGTLKRLSDRYTYVEALWITDQEGWPRGSSRVHPAPKIDSSDRPYFHAHQAGVPGPLLSPLTLSRVTGEPNIVLSRRLAAPDDAFRGMVQAVLSPAYFLEFYRALQLPPTAEVALFRDDLAVVLRFPELPVDQALELVKWPGRAPLGQSSPWMGTETTTSSADGLRRIESFRRIAGFPVYVSVGLGLDEIRGEWRAKVVRQGALAGAALLALLGLSAVAFRLARRIETAHAELEGRVRARTAELDAALAARDLLLKEVNHRVKNNLQLVSSLLSLQSRRGDRGGDGDGLGEARLRVLAIAELHEKLYRSARQDVVELGAYLTSLCEDLRASVAAGKDRRLEVRVTPVEVPTDIALPLALIVTELVTNAQKHAYDEAAAGVIAVTLERTAAGLRVGVEDDGRGLGPGGAGGFGTALVEALVRQIHGELAQPPRPRGTRTEIDVPLAPAATPLGG